MTFAPQTREELEELLRSRLPESAALEYKEHLILDTKEQKRELLKDLTAMGNGGGGTVLFGIEEDAHSAGVPQRVKPLTDLALPARVEDVVRSGVRPPLLFRLERIPWDAGYVLVIQVFRSPLGPYMVQGYGDHRYYVRHGSAAVPMNEQQVREAYALSLRTQETHREAWAARALPIELPNSRLYLGVSAVPLGPPRELIPPGPVDPRKFGPPDEWRGLAQLGGYEGATLNPRLWADGVYGQAPEPPTDPLEVFRLHRDGAVGLARSLPWLPTEGYLASMVAAQLVYIGWLWTRLELRDLVEIEIRLHNPDAERLPLDGLWDKYATIQQPPGSSPIVAVRHRVVIASGDLQNARCRHRLVWEFANKICHAYGRPQASSWRFTEGVLYGRDGQPTGLVVVGGGIQKIGRLGDLVAKIYENGRVERTPDSRYVGHFSGGVLLDEDGNAIAATELAVSTGLPAGFLVTRPSEIDRPPPKHTTPLKPTGALYELPRPTQAWSPRSIGELLEVP
jgi:hypothetical protein